MHFIIVLVTLMSIVCRNGADRDHKVAYLSVTNGESQGGWGNWQICSSWGIATGFYIKIQSPLGPMKDDTALNAIKLKCSISGYVTSNVGYDGSYGPLHSCPTTPYQKYLKQFKLRVDPYQGTGYDDTSANDIKFKCGYKMAGGLETLSAPEGGDLGTFGSWSAVCPDNSAICGLRTRIHYTTGDKTALNDVEFVCCN